MCRDGTDGNGACIRPVDANNTANNTGNENDTDIILQLKTDIESWGTQFQSHENLKSFNGYNDVLRAYGDLLEAFNSLNPGNDEISDHQQYALQDDSVFRDLSKTRPNMLSPLEEDYDKLKSRFINDVKTIVRKLQQLLARINRDKFKQSLVEENGLEILHHLKENLNLLKELLKIKEENPLDRKPLPDIRRGRGGSGASDASYETLVNIVNTLDQDLNNDDTLQNMTQAQIDKYIHSVDKLLESLEVDSLNIHALLHEAGIMGHL
jgi:superfamily I DNA/RNA helicase